MRIHHYLLGLLSSLFYSLPAWAQETIDECLPDDKCCLKEINCLKEGMVPILALSLTPILMLIIGYVLGIQRANSRPELGARTAMFQGQSIGVFLAAASFIALLFAPFTTTQGTLPDGWLPLVIIVGLIGVFFPVYAFFIRK